MNTYEVPFNELSIDINEIYKGLGYGDVYPTEEIQAMVQEMVKNISNVCKPMYGYEIFDNVKFGNNNIIVDGEVFFTGKLITTYLKKAERIIIFIVTAGRYFQQWVEKQKIIGDIWNQFLIDVIGTEIVEATLRVIKENVYIIAKKMGKKLATIMDLAIVAGV